MTMGTHGSAEGADPITISAERYWNKSGATSDMLVAAFQEIPAVESIGHFSNGFVDCILQRVPPDDPMTEQDRLEAAGRPGRRLIVRMQDFDTTLAPLKTGDLMRMVVETENGGVYSAIIKADLHLVGVTLAGGGAVADLDQGMNRLVTRIREAVHHLPDEVPGGLLGGDLADQTAERHLFFKHFQLAGSAAAMRWQALWRDNLNTTDLQYAAYYRDWTPVCQGDVFGAVPLGDKFLNIAPTARRSLYWDLAKRLRADIARLRSSIRPLLENKITRLVLDVQEGAVYIHWLDVRKGEGHFLVGVTLDQHMVDHAERRLRRLASGVQSIEDDWLVGRADGRQSGL